MHASASNPVDMHEQCDRILNANTVKHCLGTTYDVALQAHVVKPHETKDHALSASLCMEVCHVPASRAAGGKVVQCMQGQERTVRQARYTGGVCPG